MSKKALKQLIDKLQNIQMTAQSRDSYSYIQGKLDLAQELFNEMSKNVAKKKE